MVTSAEEVDGQGLEQVVGIGLSPVSNELRAPRFRASGKRVISTTHAFQNPNEFAVD